MGSNAADPKSDERADELGALYAAAVAIGGELDLGARLERVLDAALGITGALQARIALADPETGEVEIVATRGVNMASVGMRQPAGTGLVGEVLRSNAAVRSDDLFDDPRTWDRALAMAGGTRSWLGVPFADENGAFGALILLSAERAAFGAEHERRLSSFAALAGAAIREARLHERMRKEVEERRRAEDALRASEARYRALTEALVEAVYEADLTDPLVPSGVPVFYSGGVERVTGYPPEVWYRSPTLWRDRLHPEDKERVLAAHAALLEGDDTLQIEYRWIKPSGEVIWIEDRSRIERAPDGRPLMLRGTNADITARKRLEEALRSSEERYHLAARATSEALWDWDMAGRVAWSDGVERLLGYALADVPDTLDWWVDHVHPEDRERVTTTLDTAVESGAPSWSAEYRLRRADGSYIHTLDRGYIVRDASGRPTRMVGSVQDISDRRRAEEALTHQALHDALTGLPNRTLLRDRLRGGLSAAARARKPLALLLLDLDRFKDVNDTLGHQVGDLLLQEIAQRLPSALRASDTVARLGGDEFAVLLPGDGIQAVEGVARKLLRVLEPSFEVGSHGLQVRASIGAALYPEHGLDAETLLRHADVAMYQAKRAGSGFALYDSGSDGFTAARLTLVQELREAIEQGGLTLHYQPKVETCSGRTEGVEALARWTHPQRGPVSPDEFIPLAEETGIIAPLSEWVLATALEQCRAWSDAGLDLTVAVNLSMRNLQDPSLPGTVASQLAHWRVPARRLTVEITETVVMADPGQAHTLLAQLRALGVRVSLDDFGTGHSSLGHLRHLPVDELKIDRSFVRDLLSAEGGVAFVRAAIDLGHALGLRVVAEGIEDAATWQKLAELGCDAGQGYFLGRPVPAEHIVPTASEQAVR